MKPSGRSSFSSKQGFSEERLKQLRRLTHDELLTFALKQAEAAHVVPLLEMGPANLRLRLNMMRALKLYAPKPYFGRVTLFNASDKRRHLDPSMGWEGLAGGGLEIHAVPGDHFSMVEEPHVRELAAKLMECLAVAENRLQR